MTSSVISKLTTSTAETIAATENTDANVCDWLFCPSDLFFSTENFNSGMMRISPISNKCYVSQRRLKMTKNSYTSGETSYASNADLIKIEPYTNVYYFHFGDRKNGNINCFIQTMSYKWPEKYTILIWAKWQPNRSDITTFDSASNAPIVGSTTGNCYFGCVSSHPNGWVYAKQTKMLLDEWQFVVAVGGRVDDGQMEHQTQFFCGSLIEEPTFRETVGTDICGYCTTRIGNATQGPGKIAYIKVLKCHLGIEQIVEEYHMSMDEICCSFFWTKEEYIAVVLLLNGYCFGVQDIWRVIVHYCCRKAVIDKFSCK